MKWNFKIQFKYFICKYLNIHEYIYGVTIIDQPFGTCNAKQCRICGLAYYSDSKTLRFRKRKKDPSNSVFNENYNLNDIEKEAFKKALYGARLMGNYYKAMDYFVTAKNKKEAKRKLKNGIYDAYRHIIPGRGKPDNTRYSYKILWIEENTF